MWTHVRAAMTVADEAFVYDNSDAVRPYRLLAVFRFGRPVLETGWPAWAPVELTAAPS